MFHFLGLFLIPLSNFWTFLQLNIWNHLLSISPSSAPSVTRVLVLRCSGAPMRSLLVLEEGARPAQLALCRPPGDSRFALQMRRGGVVKIHDTVLMPGVSRGSCGPQSELILKTSRIDYYQLNMSINKTFQIPVSLLDFVFIAAQEISGCLSTLCEFFIILHFTLLGERRRSALFSQSLISP